MWFRLCFQHAPDNIENVLDLTKMLFEHNCIGHDGGGTKQGHSDVECVAGSGR
jgi:hypothetical protein